MTAGQPIDAIVDTVRLDAPVLELVVPVHNEERILEASIVRLRRYLDEQFPFSARLTVADNASTDDTWDTASRMARTVAGVRAVHLPVKGRGQALRAVWSTSDARVVAYTDVDLSTDLAALLPLVAPLLSGHSDVAIGSRLAPGASVARGAKRELISRSYNAVIRAAAGRSTTDAQCGFKAMTATAAGALLPEVADDGWFFDTELILAARTAGLRIFEVPVDWVDDPDSRVAIVSTAWTDLVGLARVAHRRLAVRAVTLAAYVLAASVAGLLAGRAGPVPGLLGSLAALVLEAAGTGTWTVARSVRGRRAALRTGTGHRPGAATRRPPAGPGRAPWALAPPPLRGAGRRSPALTLVPAAPPAEAASS